MDIKATAMSHLEQFAMDRKGWLFRGHQSPDWKLETSLERATRRCGADQVQYERAIFREFMRHAHSFGRTPKDTDTFEWLAFMQHYGAPTRLLDFTQSFWIALFFAYEDADNDCAVIALNPSSLRPNVPGTNYNIILKENIESLNHIDNYLYRNVPFYTNERLAIQKGTFVFSLNIRRTFEDLVTENQKKIDRLIISQSLFLEIRQKLNDFNCTSQTLFPGLDGYARQFKNYTAD